MLGPSREETNTQSPKSQSQKTIDTLDVDDIDPKEVIRTSDGEIIHEPTGLILKENQIDHGPEWRAFNHSKQQAKSRVGAPTTKTLPDDGLTTTIDWKNQDASGRSLSSQKRSQIQRLRRWQDRIRTQNAGERNLQVALSEIDRMASALGIPDPTQEAAAVMYRRALNENLIRGRSIEGVSTAMLYAACRLDGIPRSLEELEKVARVGRKEIGRTYSYVSTELNLKMEPVDPKQYIPRFASQLNLSGQTQIKAKEVIDSTAEQGLLSGKSPSGIAAGALYTASFLCDERRTQREVADTANVSKVTVRNRYQEQVKVLDIQR